MDGVRTSQDVAVQESVTVAGEQMQDAEQRGNEVPAVDRALVAQLVAGAREQGLDLTGENGLLGQLTKLVLESARRARLPTTWATSPTSVADRPTATAGTAPGRRRC